MTILEDFSITKRSKANSQMLIRIKFRQFLRACLHGGGVPQIGEVTRLGGVARLSI